MKRIIICLALLVAAVWMSVFAYMRVERVNSELEKRIDILELKIPGEDSQELSEMASELAQYWESEERLLIRFVRHSYIDLVTTSMARLPALAEHGEYGELHAELLNIRRQMRHILSSEKLALNNFL